MSATGTLSTTGLITSVRLRRTWRRALARRSSARMTSRRRYAVQHEQHVEGERAKRADSS
jgi:hypothetical protein